MEAQEANRRYVDEVLAKGNINGVIKLNHGGSCDLNLTVPPITPKDFTYQIDCNGGNSPGTYKIKVNKGAG